MNIGAATSIWYPLSADKNTQVDSVQFVMKVAEIQIEEEEAPVIQEEVKPSFWQKLVNLFK